MKKLPVTVCIISAAEAHRIGQCLRSVADWAGEIVVVMNPEVADGTDDIASAHGAQVYREPWKGFVGQKNSAADKATRPWILGLDADEVVPAALRAELEQTLGDADLTRSTSAFCFPRCTFYCGRWIRHGDWYPDRVTRLWKKDAARWEGIEPHAYLRVRGPIGRLRHDLHHFSNESIDRQIAKIAPYSDSFVQHYLERGKRAGVLDLAIRPWWRFFRAYLFKFGFLDGWPGYYIAWLSAFSAVTRYAKVRERQTPPSPSPNPSPRP
jgi:glycosyltransferase involved in cell wall biosynthesis